MLIQELQTCETCGGTGCETEFCPHCGQPYPVSPWMPPMSTAGANVPSN